MKRDSSSRKLDEALTKCHSILSVNMRNGIALDSLTPAFEKYFLQFEKLDYRQFCKALMNILFYHLRYEAKKIDSKLIFWPIQLHHVDTMNIVWDQLKKRNIEFDILVFRNDVFEKIKALGLSPTLVEGIKEKRSAKHMFMEFIRMTSLISQGAVTFSSMFRVSYLKTLIHIRSIEDIPIMFRHSISSDEGVRHVVGYDLSVIGRSIVKAAKAFGQKTLRIQNGAPNYYLAGLSEVDCLFLWDNQSSDAYRQRGFSGDIIVTGNMLLESKLNNLNMKFSYWKESLSRFDKTVFVAFSGPGHNTSISGHRRSIEILKTIARENSNLCFLIKLHPKDSIFYYNRLTKCDNVFFTDNIFSDSKVDALDILLNSDLLITGASTVALDAINLGIKVVSVDPLSELQHFKFLENLNVLKIEGEFIPEKFHSFINTPSKMKDLSNINGARSSVLNYLIKPVK